MSDFNSQHNRLVWFDLGVTNLDRAVNFYQSVLNINVEIISEGEFQFGVLEHEKGNGGCLVPMNEVPSTGNLLIYFNVDGRIQDAVAKVAGLGGKLIEPIHAIGPHGFRAIVLDSEGNKIVLHSESNK